MPDRDQFIDRFNDAGAFQVDSGELLLDRVKIGHLNVSYAAEDVIEVSRIEVSKPYRGQGYARGAMEQLLEISDELGLTVALTPSSDWGSSKERLTRFYASLGFVKNQGRKKDFRFRATMYREPRVAARAREMREDGRPDCRGPINDWTWYHGSWNRFDSFRSERRHTFGRDPSMTPIFLTCERDTARAHAGPRGWIYTVEVVGAQPFTSESIFADGWPKWWPPTAEQLTPIGRELLRDLETGRIFADATEEDADEYLRSIALSHYDAMESSEMKAWLAEHGYNAFYVRETPRDPVLSLAVMDPGALRIVHAESVGYEMRDATSIDTLVASTNARYPRAGREVDGRLVRTRVPNLNSIDGYFAESQTLSGVRVFPMSDLGGPRTVFYAADDFERSERLADAIRASGEINPLIIGVDKEGPFIIEGAHRYVALYYLKATAFPAVVVVGDDG